MSEDNDEYTVPLQDQRVFGAGLTCKGIAFVPASQSDSALPVSNIVRSSTNTGDRYLSIVLSKSASQTPEPSDIDSGTPPLDDAAAGICSVCKQSIDSAADGVAKNVHESSIAHQVCLEHSHPPSHLDRAHVGVRYLSGYGWDPDSRVGLGARQEGIRIPIKAKEKHDTVGLRERIDEDSISMKKAAPVRKKEKLVPLDAGAIRKQDVEAKKRAERLRSSFYGPDLSHYLGTDDAPVQSARTTKAGIRFTSDFKPR